MNKGCAEIESMIQTLSTAVRAADLYLNQVDQSPPSRAKAETRALVEEAIGLLRPQCECQGRHTCERFNGVLVTVRED